MGLVVGYIVFVVVVIVGGMFIFGGELNDFVW